MQVKLDGLHVMVGMPLYGAPTTKTTLSLLKTQGYCIKAGIRFDYTTATGFVTVARDIILAQFLASDADKLFWIDGDMAWSPEAFCKMLALSTLVDTVCASYPQKQAGPNVYMVNADETAVSGQYGLIEIYGAGLGFSVWSREACQALSDSKRMIFDNINNEYRKEVFCVRSREGQQRTEDINAFEDLRNLGFKVWLDPTIELGHIGTKEWRGAASEMMIKETA
jgi:hypothetical protein